MKKKLMLLVLSLVLILSAGLTACNKDPVTYTVTFMNGTTVFETKTAESGKTITKPSPDPAKQNYAFAGWYEELNVDGTGSGTAFVFTSAITKNLTLYAAFIKDEAPAKKGEVTAFINGMPQFFDSGDTLSPAAYGMEYYDYTDFNVAVLEEDTVGFTIPEAYAYRDITQSGGFDGGADIFYTAYSDFDEEADIQLYCKVYNGYTYLTVWDADWSNGIDVSYYVYGDITTIEYTDNVDEENNRFIIANKDTTRVYTVKEWTGLDDGVTVDEAFLESYGNNGVVIIEGDRILKDGYLEVCVSDGEAEAYILASAGKTYTLPSPYGENPLTEYLYDSPVCVPLEQIDFSFALDDFMSLEDLYADYSDEFDQEWFTVGDIQYLVNTYGAEFIERVSYVKRISGMIYRYDISYSAERITSIDYDIYPEDDYGAGIKYSLGYDKNGDLIAALRPFEEVSVTKNTFSFSVDFVETYRILAYEELSLYIVL